MMAEAEKKENIDVKVRKERPRIHTLDELKGFAILCMVFFHAFFTIGYFFHWKWGMSLFWFFMPAEPYFAGLFIVLSGIACNLSHSNLERGVKLALIALLISLVTFFTVGPDDMIKFGILHMLASGMLLYGLSNKYLKLIPSWLGILLCTLLFVFTLNFVNGTVGFPFLFTLDVPKEWYSTDFLFMLGLPKKGFTSGDYFPLIPWLFLFFAGTYLGRIAVKRKFPKWMFKKRIPPFAFMGRHSLLIYLAHQPILFGICYVVQWISSLSPQA